MRRFVVTTGLTSVPASGVATVSSPVFTVPMPTGSYVRLKQAVALASDTNATGKFTINALRVVVNWQDQNGTVLRSAECPADVQFAGQALPGGQALTVALPREVDFDPDDFVGGAVASIGLVATSVVTNADAVSAHNFTMTGKFLFEQITGDAP